MRMRIVTNEERIIVQEYFLQFAVDVNKVEGVLVRIGIKVFLVKKEVLKVARKVAKRGLVPYAAGVEIGTFLKGFEPSIGAADVIGAYTNAKTVINEEGEKLFSYGRDVFVQNVVKGKREGMMIVVNERSEVLGIGVFDGKMLKNVIDKGFYLRGKRGRR